MNKTIPFLIFLLSILGCNKVLHVTTTDSTVKVEEATTPASDEINALINPYKSQIEKEMNQVIGNSAKDLTKAKPESSLGNWTADLIHKKSEEYYNQPIDFAIVNYGGLRIPNLPKGEIKKSDIFELMPFENGLVVLHADGETVQKLFERMAEYGGWPVSHHIRFKIKNEQPTDIAINGKPIEKNKIYKIALSDFIANGGDKCSFFKDKKRDLLGKLFRDAIMEHVMDLASEGKEANAKIEGRVELLHAPITD